VRGRDNRGTTIKAGRRGLHPGGRSSPRARPCEVDATLHIRKRKCPTAKLPFIQAERAPIAELCRRFHVRRLDLFGSAARGTDFDPSGSDVDLPG
jgi:hypothetical protein